MFVNNCYQALTCISQNSLLVLKQHRMFSRDSPEGYNTPKRITFTCPTEPRAVRGEPPRRRVSGQWVAAP